MSVVPRLRRLFAADNRCLNVAVDHGFFNEWPFLQGIEDMSRAVQTLLDAKPDAIQLTAGQAKHLQFASSDDKPAFVLRTDVANVYGSELPRTLFSHVMDDTVEQALRLDAACVVVNLFRIPNQPEVHQQCVENVSRLKPLCERYGMPLMVEPLVMQSNSAAGGYMVDGDIKKIVPLVRQATELGADIIKADPCDNLEEYHLVVQAASGCPVLPRGGGKVPDDEVLRRTSVLIEQGASGIVYGRNIIQHANPAKMTRALMAIVHGSCDLEQAKQLLV
ncbi:class I fructose-bisphosphate aldolase [Lacipirellula parvula]|uniref:Fructose-1,6-bisphosphate aldolase n=1 Tax=Lacipirellula parvula TaxID=2650471 RepID=A0A5K7X4E4_9BACT|nr:aldolase [Lacipirellula parvula]BBO31255.1 fructose-1,6-bisphosphate aldolase [Lacipirellula parvula]